MVPEGWGREPLAKVAEVRTGFAKGKQGQNDPVEVPYLRVANVQDGHLNLSEIKTIVVERDKVERYSLKEGDVLMTEGGDFDKLGRGDVWQGQIEPCLHQNHVFAVRPNRDKVLPYFLSALSGSGYGKDYFLRCAKRSTNLASINSTQLKEFPVLVPPLPEQRKIAEILSTWDKAIETVEKLIENSQQKKKALMQQLLFGKRRFPGFDGEWKEVRLGDLVSIATSASKTKYIDENGERFIIDMGSVSREGKLIPSKRTNYAKDFLSQGQLVMPKDDIGGGNIIGRVGHIDQGSKYILGDHVYALTASEVDSLFLSYLINSYQVNKSLRRKANGTAQLGLGKKDVEKQVVKIPSDIGEQKKIAASILMVDAEVESLVYQRESLLVEKKALMQQLLTGKRRVAEVHA